MARPLLGPGQAALISGIVGFGVMAAEVCSARLLAPFFGTSTPVWATLIATVMASLALGNLAGGRLSARRASGPTLGWLLVASSVLLAVLPALVRWLLRGALALFLRGSVGSLVALAAVAMPLVALPIFTLGATSPLLLQEALGDREQAGQVGGRLAAASTAGGLLGTLVPGVLLVPLLGTAASLWLAAAMVGALGLWSIGRGRRAHALAALAVGTLLAAAPAMAAPGIAPRPGARVLFEEESAHGFLQVLEQGGERQLRVNEGYAVQSVARLDGRLPLEDVWGQYALGPAWTRGGPPHRVLLLGLGGGTAARTLSSLFPGAAIVGVEIDARMVELGRRHLGLPPAIRVVEDDARSYLLHDASRYDLIIVDAFQFPYVPFQLTTREFVRDLATHLEEGGALMMNVGRDGAEYAVVDAVARTLAGSFAHVAGIDVASGGNTLLVATGHPLREVAGPTRLGLAPEVLARLGALPAPHPWPIDRSLAVLTDDRAPVEWLTDGILTRRLLGLAPGQRAAVRP